METKHKVKSLDTLRSGPKVNGKKLVIDSLKLFNLLLIISKRQVKTKQARRFELTPTPIRSCESQRRLQRVRKAFVEPIEPPPCTSLVIDGGWLMYNIKWEANLTWNNIAENYL